MQFKLGAKVLTADGEDVGEVGRVVLEPDTNEVTHLVVQKGLLFTEDKIVPMSLVGPSTEDRVTLRENADDLEELPDFQEAHYVSAPSEIQPPLGSEAWALPLYHYPPLGQWQTYGRLSGTVKPKYIRKTVRNIPESTIVLEEGNKVVARDGDHIGDVERVFTDPLEDRATHLLISEGLLLKEKKLIPTSWINDLSEDEIRLWIPSDFVDNLPEYQLQD